MALLAGGVGGARMARALRAVLDPGLLTVVVNVGDNTERYGVHIAADPDTVMYTLADTVGQHGWGRANDTFEVMGELASLGLNTAMALGDKDFAVCSYRAAQLRAGIPLSTVTRDLAERFGLSDVSLLPASDDLLETFLQTDDGVWLDFQTYFVDRHHSDPVTAVAFHGSAEAGAAPGVVDAIDAADVVIIAPSNPPLSIWPILAIDDIDAAVRRHGTRVAVSPLFGGRPLKGPADTVMRGLGLPAGSAGVVAAYGGLIDALFIDQADRADAGNETNVELVPVNTRLDAENGPALAATILDHVSP